MSLNRRILRRAEPTLFYSSSMISSMISSNLMPAYCTANTAHLQATFPHVHHTLNDFNFSDVCNSTARWIHSWSFLFWHALLHTSWRRLEFTREKNATYMYSAHFCFRVVHRPLSPVSTLHSHIFTLIFSSGILQSTAVIKILIIFNMGMME